MKMTGLTLYFYHYKEDQKNSTSCLLESENRRAHCLFCVLSAPAAPTHRPGAGCWVLGAGAQDSPTALGSPVLVRLSVLI